MPFVDTLERIENFELDVEDATAAAAAEIEHNGRWKEEEVLGRAAAALGAATPAAQRTS